MGFFVSCCRAHDIDWCHVRVPAVFKRYERRPNERVLTRKAGMAYHVGKHGPGREWQKAQLLMTLRIILKRRSVFHEVVELAHSAVVGAVVEESRQGQASLR